MKITSDMKKLCVIYTRVSSEKQVDGYSLDSQEELCRKRAIESGYEVLKVYKEEGISAKTTNRPVLKNMLTFCLNKKNNISTIFIYSLSRLNRNTGNHIAITGILAKAGVELVSLSEPTGTTPVQRFMGTMFAGMAQLENEMRGENVANSLHRRFLEGNITSKPPLGYLMQKVNGKSIAVRDNDSFLILQSMWKKVAYEGWTLSKVADELNKKGVVSKATRRFTKFTPKAMSKIFSNKFYIGILVSKKYGEAQGKHEAMIDDILYFRVKDVLSGRKPKRSQYTFLREDFKLRKILKCVYCEKLLTSSWSQGRSEKVPLYYCQSRGIHRIDSYNRDDVEIAFIELLKTITYDKDFLIWYTEIIKEKYHTQYDDILRTHKIIEQDIEELEQAKKISRQKNTKGIYTDDEYLEMKNEYDAEITTRKGLLAEKKMMELDIDKILEFIVFYFSHLDRVWLDATPEGRVAIAGSIFPDGVVWDGKQFRTVTLGLGYEATKNAKNASMNSGEPAGIRTQDQELKRLLLYH